jgi:putative ABC transport system substrate-binding protein
MFVVAVTLMLAVPAQADKDLIQVGVLALGPRKMPSLHCGPAQMKLASAESPRETMPYYVVGLRDQLEKLGYLENVPENGGRPGRRFALDLKMGTLDELRTYAREFANRPMDVIVGIATAAVQIAKEETEGRGIPILMTGVSDPTKATGDGFVDSLARPGGLITGVSHPQVQGRGKRVELLTEMLPGLRRMVTFRRPGYAPAEKSLADTRAAAERLNIELVDWTAANREALLKLLSKVRRDTLDAMMVLPDSLVISNMDAILETSLEQRVPTFGLQDFMAEWGALGAYGPSAAQAGGRVAVYVDKILKGAWPGGLPIEPIDPILVVNLKAAECHGIALPLEFMRQVDRVVR